MFLERFGDCATSTADAQALAENATEYTDRFALEVGFLPCASRVGVPNARAAWFTRDVPESMAPPTWWFPGSRGKVAGVSPRAVVLVCGECAEFRDVTRIVVQRRVRVSVSRPCVGARVPVGFRAARPNGELQ